MPLLSIEHGAIVAKSHGRSVVIANEPSEEQQYRALLLMGVTESVALALVKGLITVKTH